VAGVGLLIVIILIALGVHSCQVSARVSALKDYTNNVSSLISLSNQDGQSLFKVLSSAPGSGSAISVYNEINQTRSSAEKVLSRTQGLSAPDSVKTADQHLLLALQARVDGITNIANEIQPALGTSANQDAISSIAAEMARLYASDVLYKDYTVPLIVSALHAAGIDVGGTNGETLDSHQFVPDVRWLLPSFVATELHVTLPSSPSGKVAAGLHGHSLDSVSVAGTTLQTGSTNTIPAKPAPTFTLNFTNGGTNNESNVVCKVAVTGASSSGQTVVPETTAGQHATCQVTLKPAPAPGTYTVQATIGKVPGEKNLSNNSMSFPVTFQ
jgi:hypothetical protein